MKESLETFRKVAFWEGISAVLLFFVAMPLKYFADMPMAVTVVGYLHGFLFLAFIIFMANAGIKYKWQTGIYVICMIASFIPIGTFVLDAMFLKPLSKK